MNTKGELGCCGLAPPLREAERQACHSQSCKARDHCNLTPRDGIFNQTVSRLPAANHVFLRSRMVNICQELRSLRSTLQRKHMAKPETVLSTKWPGPGEVIKTHSSPGIVHMPSTWSPELLRPGKGTKCTPNPQRLSQNCV